MTEKISNKLPLKRDNFVKLQLMLNPFSAGKFKLEKKNTQISAIFFTK